MTMNNVAIKTDPITTAASARRNLLFGILSILMLDCLAIGFNIPFLRQFLGLIITLSMPGFLLIVLFNFVCANLWEYWVMSLGLSIAFLEFMGLLFNQVFIQFNFADPLTEMKLISLVVSGCLGIGLLIWFRKRDLQDYLQVAEHSSTTGVSLFIPALFPMLGGVGAIFLNNRGNNFIAVTALILISVFVLFVVWKHEQISEDLLGFSILMIGLALLLSFSLRSWHISGWDINQEYYVYQLTKFHQEWRIDFFRDPYNACLSLTILPAILNSFLGINEEFLFKVIYPSIFAFVPLIIYLSVKKYVAPILAFLASMFFIFQPWFIQPAPALARQEIGLLFFALFIWVTFHQRFSRLQRNSLQILFGAAIITSHYSTAYIGLIFFTLTCLGSFVFRKFFRAGNSGDLMTQSISGWVLLVLFCFTFYWSNIQTGTSGNIPYVLQITFQNMKQALLSDLRSEDVRMAFLNTNQRFSQQDINQYVQSQNEIYSEYSSLYSNESYADYDPTRLVSTPTEGIIQGEPWRVVFSSLFFGAKQLTKILLVAGALIWILHVSRSKGFHDEFVILNLVSVSVLLLWIILPVLSLYYNLFRVYLQTLIVSSVSLIFGLNLLFSRLRNEYSKIIYSSLIVVLFFVSTNGLGSYLVGGAANMNLNNFGEDYDKFFTHPQEIYSAIWLTKNRNPKLSVYADDTASLRLISFGNGIIYHDRAVLPSTITKDSYIYLDYANTWRGITISNYHGKQISYKYPLEFLERNKNLIYDNGGSKIFR
jgi:uncharacterized membrane protein